MARFSAVTLSNLGAAATVPCDLQRVYTGQGSSGETAGFDLNGTWLGTVIFQATIDDTNWFPVVAHLVGGSGYAGPVVTTVVGTGSPQVGRYVIHVMGYSQVRALMSAYTSGGVVVAISLTASAAILLVVRELQILNDLMAILIQNPQIDVNTEYRNDPMYGM